MHPIFAALIALGIAGLIIMVVFTVLVLVGDAQLRRVLDNHDEADK